MGIPSWLAPLRATLCAAALFLLASAVHAEDGGLTENQIREVLKKVRAHQDAVDRQMENFGYLQTFRKEESGRLKSLEVSEVTFDHGRKVSRLISRNGKALEGAELDKEQKRVERQLRDLESGKAAPLSNRRVGIDDLARLSIFTAMKKMTLEGREVWSAEFHPDPKGKPSNMTERFAHNLDGRLWIDPQSLQLARMEFTLRGAFNVGGGLLFSMRPGTTFSEEKTWSFAKIWLPKARRLDMTAKAMVGVKLAIRETTEFNDFHEFDVSVSDSPGAISPAPAIH